MSKKLSKICDFIEVNFPSIAFAVVFITYIVLIFCRYVLNTTIEWVNELNTISFVWCATLCATYGARTKKDIMFTMIYDRVSEIVKTIFRLVGNLFITVMFAIIVKPTIEGIVFMYRKKTPIMDIPYSFVFFPFIFFVVLTTLYYAIFFCKDIIKIINDIKENKNE